MQIARQYEELKKESNTKTSELEEVKEREHKLQLEKEQLEQEVSHHTQEK